MIKLSVMCLFLQHVYGMYKGVRLHSSYCCFCFSGYICERKDLLVNGCCNVNVPSTKLYSCDSCLPNGCCSVYEYCVSCCLQPNKVHRLSLAFQVFSVGWVPLWLKALICQELFP